MYSPTTNFLLFYGEPDAINSNVDSASTRIKIGKVTFLSTHLFNLVLTYIIKFVCRNWLFVAEAFETIVR
jgi:hypothetical protein